MDSGRNYYGGGRGGRGYRGGGGGRHRFRGGGRGSGYRGGGNRNQPYRSRGGGRGGGRGNRFGHQQQIDPDTLLLRQISSFVSRVGEFQNLRSPSEDEPATDLRNVEYTTASNINDLLPILLAPDKLERLLGYSPDATKVEDKVGKLVHLVISCVADLPMQTPCYAALTLAVHEQAKGNAPYEGFIPRCLQYAMLQIARELDTTLLTSNPEAARSTCRLKLLLRYLCILAKMGIITVYEGESTVDPDRMSIFGFVSVLLDAATAAKEQFNNFTTSCWLALIVLSTVPYLVELQIPRDVIDEKLVKPVEHLLGNYKSTFTPGTGMTALLLKGPQVEEGDDQDDEDEEDEEDEEEGDGSGQICDSLQDLLRMTKCWRKDGHASRFALPLDAPWKGLMVKSMPNPDSGDEMESRSITYMDGPLYLSFPQECQLLNLLMSGAGSDSPMKLQYFSLEGAVFGRLPIFGSPPDPDDEDDEEDMEDGSTKNEQLEAFRSMSLLDRYFVAETLRDCLLSHESHINPAGLQLGSAKSAAEELLRVCHVFLAIDEGADASKGFEFAILETIFGLLAQCTEFSSLRHVYLSRVLLELTRLEPSRISQALAIAMTNLFHDYLPALVPRARENFSCWFAFHLINTDYQWPSGYWQLWEPYAVSDKDSSRGLFIRRSLQLMAENVSDPTPIVKHSFGSASPSLAKELLGRSSVPLEDSVAPALESEIYRRVWDSQEDATILLEFLLGEDARAALSASSSDWSLTDILMRVMLHPAKQLCEGTKAVVEKATGDIENSEDDMEDDTTFSRDVYVVVTDAFKRYKETILGVLGKDAESTGGDKEQALVQGGAFLLRRVESMVAFNFSLMEGVVASLLQNGIMNSMSVMKWVLRDVGDSFLAPILPSWYKVSIVAVRESLHLLIDEATAGGTIAIDDASAPMDDDLVNKLTSKLGQLLTYAVQRVCGLLATTQLEAKKFEPFHVDLVEGTKTLVSTGKKLLACLLTQSGGVRKKFLASEIEDVMSKSEVSGSSLSAVCNTTEDPSGAVVLLKQSLEGLP